MWKGNPGRLYLNSAGIRRSSVFDDFFFLGASCVLALSVRGFLPTSDLRRPIFAFFFSSWEKIVMNYFASTFGSFWEDIPLLLSLLLLLALFYALQGSMA